MMALRTYRGTRWGVGIVVYLAAVLTSGCGTTFPIFSGKGKKYRYSYEMISPDHNTNMLFRDDRIIIQFSFDDAAISFQLQNVSREYVTIDWTRAAVGVEGFYSSVRHNPTLYRDSGDAGSSLMLPPVGYVRNLMIPNENVRFDGDRWIEHDLLPTADRNNDSVRSAILGSVGKKVNVVIPIRFGDKAETYEFAFRVTSVDQISWRDHVAPVRVPGPPIVPRVQSQQDQMTFAIIAVGFLGFLAYVLSIPKNRPIE